MRRVLFLAGWLVVATCHTSPADDVLLQIHQASEGRLIVGAVNLTEAAGWYGRTEIDPGGIRAVTQPEGVEVPFQFVPGPDFDAGSRWTGTVLLAPPPDCRTVRLVFGPAPSKPAAFQGTVTTETVSVRHDPGQQGGLPSRIEFRRTGKIFADVRWQDRLYDPHQDGYRVADDRQATVRRVADGPICTVIQVAAAYVAADQSKPPSAPSAVYQWFYFHELPWIYVTAVQRQESPFSWREAHFLELHQDGDAFPRYAGSYPEAGGMFRGDQQSRRFDDWGGMFDARNGIAALAGGDVLVYDGKGGYGPYLHARGSLAWSPWPDVLRQTDAWLWMGSGQDPVAVFTAARRQLPLLGPLVVTLDSVRTRVAALRRQADQSDAAVRTRAALAEQFEAAGRWREALQIVDGGLPAGCHPVTAGELQVVFEAAPDGVRLLQCYDAATDTLLGSPHALPLFSLTLRDRDSGRDLNVAADRGWVRASVRGESPRGWRLRWTGRADPGLADLDVTIEVTPDAAAGALHWTWSVDVPEDRWCARRVSFPQLAVRRFGDRPTIVFPRGAGEVTRQAWESAFAFSGTYPTGWTTMQLLAAYDTDRRTGIYVAMHDPQGSTKDLRVASRPDQATVELAFAHPAPQLDSPGNDFQLTGQAVWQVVRGDWFDVARIYRRWALDQACWAPAVGPEGRADTPRWMRQLPLWALASGSPERVVKPVEAFADFFAVPVGVHWYNWHQIPFDNDYPHYFPTQPGFAEAVARLQQREIYVMPYINGRLWDSRDRGLEDAEFTRLAKPAATKDEAGEPYVETYGSTESDGSRVRLAVMCPTTRLWRDKLADTVRRLTEEAGVQAVYLDQVAAAAPQLCFDRSHGHPTGGGAWWTAAYWDLLRPIRERLPPDRVLTTECNAEAYAHVFDGYLTWHWQYDGQVPLFPAVYGGRIQMFGRAYRGGPSKDLALRMKAGQQLVYGEQIGWIDPGVIREQENAAFLRQIVQLRWKLRQYFFAGWMLRPPRLLTDVPRVTADWQWSGTWPVTTDAVLTGAWALPGDGSVVAMLVNVSDQPLTVRVDVDLKSAELPHASQRWRRVSIGDPDDSQPAGGAPAEFPGQVGLEPRSAVAWEWTVAP